MKLLFLDTETTGLDEIVHGLIQVAGIIDVNEKVADTFNMTVRPFPNDKHSDDALKMHNLTEDSLKEFNAPDLVYKQLLNLFTVYIDKFNRDDKFILVGYNANFDDRFLRKFFYKNGDKYYGSFISYPPLDIANIALYHLLQNNERSSMPDFKLGTVAKRFGVEVDESKQHDALYDIEITRELFYKLREKIKD